MAHTLGCLVAMLLLTTALAPTANAWGSSAHSVVAEIAQRRLGPKALHEVEQLLGKGVSLASVASHADTEAALDARARRTHFVNIPFHAERYDASRDCADDSGPSCIVSALDAERAKLANRALGHDERARALKRLVHLVADIHQPLHCADRGDQGGNLLAVTFHGEATNLHRVWDFAALDKVSYDWGVHLEKALAEIPVLGASASDGANPDFALWASHSHRLAVNVVYKLPNDLKLGADYQAAIVPIIHKQLARAGVRLASLLEDALSRGRAAAGRRRGAEATGEWTGSVRVAVPVAAAER
jgi:hypothetical protein